MVSCTAIALSLHATYKATIISLQMLNSTVWKPAISGFCTAPSKRCFYPRSCRGALSAGARFFRGRIRASTSHLLQRRKELQQLVDRKARELDPGAFLASPEQPTFVACTGVTSTLARPSCLNGNGPIALTIIALKRFESLCALLIAIRLCRPYGAYPACACRISAGRIARPTHGTGDLQAGDQTTEVRRHVRDYWRPRTRPTVELKANLETSLIILNRCHRCPT